MKKFEHCSPAEIKTAGLKSSRFTREVYRYEAPPMAKISGNCQNQSSITFGQDCPTPDRFSRTPVHELEIKRMEAKKEKIEERLKVRREWRSNIEAERWAKLDMEKVSDKEKLDFKRRENYKQISASSYNPITHSYMDTSRAKSQKDLDEAVKHRVAIRSAKLYSKNNTFDPILNMDIPHIPIVDDAKLAINHPIAKHLNDAVVNSTTSVSAKLDTNALNSWKTGW